jgi:hypothetical protein
MKKFILLSLVITLIIGSCIAQKSKYPQGAWQLVQVKTLSEDGKVLSKWPMPSDMYKYMQIKIWTEKHYMFGSSVTYPLKSGKDTTEVGAGGGSFTLMGTKYDETPLFHSAPVYRIFPLLNMELVLKGDTLFQTYHPLNNDGTPAKTIAIEKYIKMD